MRALDLFCGGGGAAEGLVRAGFDVVGIDNRRCNARAMNRWRRAYPGELIIADALAPPVNIDDFDFVWASPPCQLFSSATPRSKRPHHVDLIKEVRELLASHPWTCIENVPRAPIRADVVLTGPAVGLHRIARLRHFEISWPPPAVQPEPVTPPRADWLAGKCVTVTTSMSAPSHYYPRKRAGMSGRVGIVEAREVMGMTNPHTTLHEVGNAVPPAYAEYIAQILMESPAWT